MTLAQATRGVLRAPVRTFEALAESGSWKAMVALCVAVSAASWATLYSTERGQLALADQWERTAYAAGRPVDDATYDALLAWSARGPAYAVVRACALHGGLSMLVAAGLTGLVRWRATTRPTFGRSFTLVAHAGVVLALRDSLSAPLAYLRETTSSATTLGPWFPSLDEATTVARVAGTIDVFVVWWVILLAVAASVLAHQPARRWMGPLVAAYVGVAVVVSAALEMASRT